jgi:hypothetical protein
MRPRAQGDRLASYVVILDPRRQDRLRPTSLTDFAAYLSTVAVAGLEVIVAELPETFDDNDQVLRWVGHHVRIRPQHRSLSGTIDPLRVAMDVASWDKVIVADERVRYGAGTLHQIQALLDAHEVVEPQDYFDPLPWWGGIDAGRMLVHRGVDRLPDHGATFGFRRSVLRGLRAIDAGAAFPLVLAMRGRVGAAQFFPGRACLYAPLWVLERSISVYWALFRRLPQFESRVTSAVCSFRTEKTANCRCDPTAYCPSTVYALRYPPRSATYSVPLTTMGLCQ